MANDQKTQDQQPVQTTETPVEQQGKHVPHDATDGLKDKKPEDLTPEELRLMADTMPGEGPGD